MKILCESFWSEFWFIDFAGDYDLLGRALFIDVAPNFVEGYKV